MLTHTVLDSVTQMCQSLLRGEKKKAYRPTEEIEMYVHC